MPIVAYTGLPGHGKSHSVVEHVILPSLKAGRCVVTNLALNVDLVKKEFPGCDVRLFDIDSLKAAPSTVSDVVPPGAVWVIDECWKLWPAGESANKTPEAFRSILAEHRHRVDEAGQSMQVILVTQDLMQIASFARQLVEQTFRTVKLSTLGVGCAFRIDIYTGPALGPNPPEKNRVTQSGGRYRKEIWRFYRTHTMSAAGAGSEGANERTVDRRIVIWRSWVWWFGAPLVLIAFGVGVWRVWKFFHPAPDAARPSSMVVQSPGAARAVKVKAEPQWRITGSLLGGKREMVYLSDGQYYVTLDPADYCDRDVSGFLICTWRGQRITNQLKELPRYDRVQSLSMFGQPLVTAESGSGLSP